MNNNFLKYLLENYLKDYIMYMYICIHCACVCVCDFLLICEPLTVLQSENKLIFHLLALKRVYGIIIDDRELQ